MIDPAFYAENPDLISVMQAALIKIQAIQPSRMAWFRQHEVIFDKAPGGDVQGEDYWQNIAFQIYNDLCEVESIASTALAYDTPESVAEKMEGVRRVQESFEEHFGA